MAQKKINMAKLCRKAIAPRDIPPDIPEIQFSQLQTTGNEIGGGSFASCEIVKIKPNEERRVMKKMTLYEKTKGKNATSEETMYNKIIKESRLVNTLNHRNVVQFFGLVKDPLSMIMELMEFEVDKLINFDDDVTYDIQKCHDLEHLLSMISDGELEELFAEGEVSFFDTMADDIAQGLNYVHKQGQCHRDLKPSNILIANCDKRKIICKLSDFGEGKAVDIQTRIGATQIHSLPGQKGTVWFNAPEQYDEERKDLEQLQKMDVWSYAMILFCILNPNRKSPWEIELRDSAESLQALQRVMTKGNIPIFDQRDWHKNSLLQKAYVQCAKVKPEDRPDMNDVCRNFERPTSRENDSLFEGSEEYSESPKNKECNLQAEPGQDNSVIKNQVPFCDQNKPVDQKQKPKESIDEILLKRMEELKAQFDEIQMQDKQGTVITKIEQLNERLTNMQTEFSGTTGHLELYSSGQVELKEQIRQMQDKLTGNTQTLSSQVHVTGKVLSNQISGTHNKLAAQHEETRQNLTSQLNMTKADLEYQMKLVCDPSCIDVECNHPFLKKYKEEIEMYLEPTTELLTKLYSCEVISNDEKQKILNVTQETGKRKVLLIILEEKSSADIFLKLASALQECTRGNNPVLGTVLKDDLISNKYYHSFLVGKDKCNPKPNEDHDATI